MRRKERSVQRTLRQSTARAAKAEQRIQQIVSAMMAEYDRMDAEDRENRSIELAMEGRFWTQHCVLARKYVGHRVPRVPKSGSQATFVAMPSFSSLQDDKAIVLVNPTPKAKKVKQDFMPAKTFKSHKKAPATWRETFTPYRRAFSYEEAWALTAARWRQEAQEAQSREQDRDFFRSQVVNTKTTKAAKTIKVAGGEDALWSGRMERRRQGHVRARKHIASVDRSQKRSRRLRDGNKKANTLRNQRRNGVLVRNQEAQTRAPELVEKDRKEAMQIRHTIRTKNRVAQLSQQLNYPMDNFEVARITNPATQLKRLLAYKASKLEVAA